MAGHYTQINVLFPSSQVELPPAEKFNPFPPEAQKAILAAFEKEQAERHIWLKNQQTYDHSINLEVQRGYIVWRMTGTIVGGILVLSCIIVGALLIYHGASAFGMAMITAALGGLIGTAIYGHKNRAEIDTVRRDRRATGEDRPSLPE